MIKSIENKQILRNCKLFFIHSDKISIQHKNF